MTASRFTASCPRESCLDPRSRPWWGSGIERPARPQRRHRDRRRGRDAAAPIPAQAIIAPLSVHNAGGGATKSSPAERRAPARRCAQPGVGGDPAGATRLLPSGMVRRNQAIALAVRSDSASQIASSTDAARSAIGRAVRAGRARQRCGAPPSSARKTRNRSPVARRAAAARKSAAGRPPAPPARSPGRRDNRDRAAWRSCRRLRRPHRRASCRAGDNGRPRRRPAAANARPRPAASR